jgi:hypothetical protein
MRVRPAGDRLTGLLERFYRLELLRPARQPSRAEQRQAAWVGWRDLIAQLRADPEYSAVVCVYCTRLRMPDSSWRRPASVLRAYLQRHQRLSHTYCADCLRGRGLS